MTVDSSTSHLVSANGDQNHSVNIVYGVAVQPFMEPVEEEVDNNFTPAFLWTGCFGLVGLCRFVCKYNTPAGRLGALVGCILHSAILLAGSVVLLVMYQQEDCNMYLESSSSGVLCDNLSIAFLIPAVIIFGTAFFLSSTLTSALLYKKYTAKPQQSIPVAL